MRVRFPSDCAPCHRQPLILSTCGRHRCVRQTPWTSISSYAPRSRHRLPAALKLLDVELNRLPNQPTHLRPRLHNCHTPRQIRHLRPKALRPPLNAEGVRHRPRHCSPASLRTRFQVPTHPDNSLKCVRATMQLWPGNGRPNPMSRRRIRLIDGEPPIVNWAAAAHPVWAECSHVVVVHSC